MAIQRLNYLDIDPAIRSKKSKEITAHLRAILSDPSASKEQRDFASKRLLLLSHWARGTLPTAPLHTDYHAMVDALEKA